MKVPLYSITAGNLATDPGSVQSQLQDVFKIAVTWKAIILLDEADIFLERRSLRDLERNRLVSGKLCSADILPFEATRGVLTRNYRAVFLQTLEYFEGTMFLTTNRVESIDEAFDSRIHVSLKYPELSEAARRRVWKNFIQTLKMDTSRVVDADLDRFAAVDLNGRQIKNMVKMAGLLALEKDKHLKPEHIEAMMRIAKSDRSTTT